MRVLRIFTLLALIPWVLPVWADAVNNNLTVYTASYLGASGDDSANAAVLGVDDDVFIGGRLGQQTLGLTALTPLKDGDADGDGVILRLNSQGTVPLSLTRLPSAVLDMDSAAPPGDGGIAVVGAFGVVLLDAQAVRLRWHDEAATAASRVAIAAGSDGAAVVAALLGEAKTVNVYAAGGAVLGRFTVDASALADIALDPISQTVIVTGYRQVTSNLQLPLLRGYSYTGTLRWQAYGFSAAQTQAENLGADSRGVRVALGRDGLLYYAGRSDGGNNVYTRRPDDISQNNPNNVNLDRFTNLSNAGSGNFGYFARFDPASGVHRQGQYLITRLSNGRANSFGINAIDADEDGRVFIAGGAAASVPCRPGTENDPTRCPVGTGFPLRINGITVGGYTLNEGAVIAIAADFSRRELVAVWAGDGAVSSSAINGLAVSRERRVIAVTSADGGSLITVNPLQSLPAGGDEWFYAIWPPFNRLNVFSDHFEGR